MHPRDTGCSVLPTVATARTFQCRDKILPTGKFGVGDVVLVASLVDGVLEAPHAQLELVQQPPYLRRHLMTRSPSLCEREL